MATKKTVKKVTNKLQDCRIAFSIHGTCCFIVATKKLDVDKLPEGMTVIKSRDSEATGVKLAWAELNNKQGKPLTNKITILSRFKKLEREGWKVDSAAFVEKHW